MGEPWNEGQNPIILLDPIYFFGIVPGINDAVFLVIGVTSLAIGVKDPFLERIPVALRGGFPDDFVLPGGFNDSRQQAIEKFLALGSHPLL